MATLDPKQKRAWKSALMGAKSPWVVCGLRRTATGKAAMLNGMAGLIDWALHGQVSRLVREESLGTGEPCLLPGDPERGRPSFILFPVDPPATPQSVAEKVRSLKVSELALAESTFPEDFLAKLKQTFKKEGIRCTKLEPVVDEPSGTSPVSS
ncbi:MAG TPA: hypothetical protein VIH99_12530 [Bdellovibrionota bacterium]|jgi:hypothetical protein